MSHYELKIKEEVFKLKVGETLPYRLPKLTPGTYQISVKAFDKAGNFTESRVEVKIESIPIPQITICPEIFRSGEELFYAAGTSLPESKVIVFFGKREELIEK